MTTWASFLADLRTDIKDPAGARWSDPLLFMYTRDAIRDYSQHFPRRVDRYELTGSSPFALPADFVSDVMVENPIDRALERKSLRPGARLPLNAKSHLYYIDGTSLYLLGNQWAGGVFISYQAIHGIPTTVADTTFVLTIKDIDLELIRIYVKAKCYEQLRGRQAGLDRFRQGTGDRTDNPIEPETSNLMDEYHRKINERYQGGAILLYRPGGRV